jgi:hypothetical protein
MELLSLVISQINSLLLLEAGITRETVINLAVSGTDCNLGISLQEVKFCPWIEHVRFELTLQ